MKITHDVLESVVKSFKSNIELTQEIFCECPYCGKIFPLSEAKLMVGKRAKIEVIKQYQERIEKLERKEEELEEKKEELEEKYKEKLEEAKEKLERKLEEKYRKREIELEKNIDKEAMKRLKELQKQEKEAREDAIKRSRAVTMGHVLETFAPILMSSKYNPKDFRPILNPIDYVVFNGLSEKNYVSEIIFVETKYGNSILSEREISVKHAIEEGKVRFEVFHKKEEDLLQIKKAINDTIALPTIQNQ